MFYELIKWVNVSKNIRLCARSRSAAVGPCRLRLPHPGLLCPKSLCEGGGRGVSIQDSALAWSREPGKRQGLGAEGRRWGPGCGPARTAARAGRPILHVGFWFAPAGVVPPLPSDSGAWSWSGEVRPLLSQASGQGLVVAPMLERPDSAASEQQQERPASTLSLSGQCPFFAVVICTRVYLHGDGSCCSRKGHTCIMWILSTKS